ncbi:unnamed protein product [Echinostoma caproni]|uniref:Microtubule-associated protein futsch n=1 Tax=Echinostoma caproni TaxID=27848 RepID=A0A183ANF8_9TREM|nr:unnamed protein product [Echinostoma caproni]
MYGGKTDAKEEDDLHRLSGVLGRPKHVMPPQPRSSYPKRFEHKSGDKSERLSVHGDQKEEKRIPSSKKPATSDKHFVSPTKLKISSAPTEQQYQYNEASDKSTKWLEDRDTRFDDISGKHHPQHVYAQGLTTFAGHETIKFGEGQNVGQKYLDLRHREHTSNLSEKKLEEESFELLAPQPFRSRRSTPSPTVHEDRKAQSITHESRIESRSISVPPVPISRGSPMNTAESKLIRRRSHLDKQLDEQIDKVYSEELVRRASLCSEHGPSIDRDSSSGLSALANYEEQQRARQIEDMLNIERSGKRSATTQPIGFKIPDEKRGPFRTRKLSRPTEPYNSDISQPIQFKERQREREEKDPKELCQVGSKQPIEKSDSKLAPGTNFDRGDTRRIPINRSSFAPHSEMDDQITDKVTSEIKDTTAPTRPSKSKHILTDQSESALQLPKNQNNKTETRKKRNMPKTDDLETHKSSPATSTKSKEKNSREESTKKEIESSPRDPENKTFLDDRLIQKKRSERPGEAGDVVKGDRLKLEEHLERAGLHGPNPPLCGQEKVAQHDNQMKRSSLDATKSKRLRKGSESREQDKNKEMMDLGRDKGPPPITVSEKTKSSGPDNLSGKPSKMRPTKPTDKTGITERSAPIQSSSKPKSDQIKSAELTTMKRRASIGSRPDKTGESEGKSEHAKKTLARDPSSKESSSIKSSRKDDQVKRMSGPPESGDQMFICCVRFSHWPSSCFV